MASAGNALRAHIEGLLTGASGTGYTLDAGRFHLVEEGKTADDHPINAGERACEVVIATAGPLVPRNPYDGFSFETFAVTVRIAYALTKAGGDLVEGLTEQNGSATLGAIRDRALTDYLDIVRVLSWPDNRGNVNPAIIALICEEPYSLDDDAKDRVIVEIPFRLDARVTTTSAYAP